MKFNKLLICLLLTLILQFNASAMTDSQIEDALQSFDSRVQLLYDKITTETFVPGEIRSTGFSRAYIASKAVYALVNLHQSTNLPAANQHLADICDYFANNPEDTGGSEDSNSWVGSVFVRIIKFFGSQGSIAAGRLDSDVEADLLALMWDWANIHSVIAKTNYNQSQEWRIDESENHDAQRYMPSWGFAMIFKNEANYQNLTYTDGYTPAQHYAAWTEYFKEYLAERAKRGLFIETASNIYEIHTLKGLFDFCDFSENAVLKTRAERLLNLFWSTWAQEQLDGVRGGGKSRVHPGTISEYDSDDYTREQGWYYFGIGRWADLFYRNTYNWNNLNVPYTALICAATSSYRPSLNVGRIALAPADDTYEIMHRTMGLAETGYSSPPDYRLPTNLGGILRYSYRTPEFIIGTAMYDAFSKANWTGISCQYRWQGVIFDADHFQARVFPQCEAQGEVYNSTWSVQKLGTLITQKLDTAINAGAMRVYFSRRGISNRSDEDGWIFAQAVIDGTSNVIAYIAVRPAWGGYAWDGDIDPQDGLQRWLKSNDEYSPVIIEVARASEFASYSSFKSAVKALPLSVNGDVLSYTGLSGNSFTFFTDYSALAQINSQTINLAPNEVYNSPFIQGDWGDGIITVNDGTEEIELNFEETDGCGIYGYLPSDLNQDCSVDLADFAILTAQWLDCTVYPASECGL